MNRKLFQHFKILEPENHAPRQSGPDSVDPRIGSSNRTSPDKGQYFPVIGMGRTEEKS